MKTWKYCGGQTLDEDGNVEPDAHSNYFALFPHLQRFVPYPPLTKCVCSHRIHQNCFITNTEENRLIVVGNCCIKRFMENCSRTCSYCVKPHRNRKDNLCNVCRDDNGFCFKCGCFYKNKILKLTNSFNETGCLSDQDITQIRVSLSKPRPTTKEPEPNTRFLDLNLSCAVRDTIPSDD